MTKIVNNFGFKVMSSPKKAKVKRTQHQILIINKHGRVLDTIKSDPRDKEATIDRLWTIFKDAETINVLLLNGHTQIYKRKLN